MKRYRSSLARWGLDFYVPVTIDAAEEAEISITRLPTVLASVQRSEG